jgi:hypothetical protein
MNDRPNISELLIAARQHIESQLVPLSKQTNPKLYFQTLVAVNVLRIVERELALGAGHARAEWQRLNELMSEQPLPASDADLYQALAERNAALCTQIRAGAHDAASPALFAHLKACAIEQLAIANPKYLAALAQEDASAVAQ